MNEITQRINDADMILIGLGEEVGAQLNRDGALDWINKLANVLITHNYFIVATFDNQLLRSSQLNQKRIVYPYKAEHNELKRSSGNFIINGWQQRLLKSFLF